MSSCLINITDHQWIIRDRVYEEWGSGRSCYEKDQFLRTPGVVGPADEVMLAYVKRQLFDARQISMNVSSLL